MDGDEWSILEEAGAFYFAFSLVPQQWYDLHPAHIQTTRGIPHNVIEAWRYHVPPASILKYCDECFIRSDSSPYDYGFIETVWSDEDYHRVELWETEFDMVAHFDVKIDVRYPYSDFLDKVIKLAIHANCLFYLCYEGDYVQPSSVAIFEALNRSPAAKLAMGRSDRP